MKLPGEEHKRLRVWAGQNGRTLQEILEEAVRKWIAENLDKPAAKAAK